MSENIYIAGFDVFYDNAVERGKRMKNICKQYGFTGLYPFDNEADNSKDILDGNLRLIDYCKYIVANLNNFRGLEMDSGTAFELGYGKAKGKCLYGYIDDVRPLIEKIGIKDSQRFNVENFGLPINLMIGMSTKIIQGNFEDCIKIVKQDFDKE